MIKFQFPESFWLIAEQIGHGRNVMNQENNKVNIRFDRGKKNKKVDTLGILGELIAMHYLTEKKTKFEVANLLDFKSSKNADFIIRGKRVDVKTRKHNLAFENDSYLLVNEEAHRKGLNKIDYYWFIYIVDKTIAEFYFFDYEKINEWKVKNMKYTNAFFIKREELKTI